MKILAHIHGYLPILNAGAEYALHGILTWLDARGHEATVYVSSVASARAGVYDGVKVVTALPKGKSEVEFYQGFDLVITHLDRTPDVMMFAQLADVPVVHYVHNDKQLHANGVRPTSAALVIHNSEWIREKEQWQGAQCVCWPPIDEKRYRVKRAKTAGCVTLINLNESKGGLLFWDLAKKLPDVPFLGVKGSYGTQHEPPASLKNARVLDMTPDIRPVYAQTAVLLAPSNYESFGRVVLEAALNGIPVIAHPTPGLQESLGDAGIFIPRTDLDGYAREIRRLLTDREHYAAVSARVRTRFEIYSRENGRQLLALESALQQARGWKWPAKAREEHPGVERGARMIRLLAPFNFGGMTFPRGSEKMFPPALMGRLVETGAAEWITV